MDDNIRKPDIDMMTEGGTGMSDGLNARDLEELNKLTEDDLDQINGGADSDLYGYDCDHCGNLGLKRIKIVKHEAPHSCSWHLVYECPRCGQYTFKSMTTEY